MAKRKSIRDNPLYKFSYKIGLFLAILMAGIFLFMSYSQPQSVYQYDNSNSEIIPGDSHHIRITGYEESNIFDFLFSVFSVLGLQTVEPGETATVSMYFTVPDYSVWGSYMSCSVNRYLLLNVYDPNGDIIDSDMIRFNGCDQCSTWVDVEVDTRSSWSDGFYEVRAEIRCAYTEYSNKDSATFKISSQPSCNVGAQCDKDYVENTCLNGDVFEKYKLYKYNSNCDCIFDKLDYELEEDCDYGCSNGRCETPPSCNIGEQCDLKDKGLNCKDGNVYRGYDIYSYNSNCDCVFDVHEATLVESCYSGCRDGECLEGTCYNGQTKCEGENYIVCENKDWVDKGITLGKCEVKCINDNDCQDNYYCDNYVCVKGESEPDEIPWLYILLAGVGTAFVAVLYWVLKK